MVSNTPWALRVRYNGVDIVDADNELVMSLDVPTNRPDFVPLPALEAAALTIVRLANVRHLAVTIRTPGGRPLWDEVPDPNAEPHMYGQYCECETCR